MPLTTEKHPARFTIERLYSQVEDRDDFYSLIGPDGLVWHTSYSPGGLCVWQRELNKAFELGLVIGARGNENAEATTNRTDQTCPGR